MENYGKSRKEKGKVCELKMSSGVSYPFDNPNEN